MAHDPLPKAALEEPWLKAELGAAPLTPPGLSHAAWEAGDTAGMGTAHSLHCPSHGRQGSTATALPALSPALCHHTPGSVGRAQTAPLPLTLLQNSSTSIIGIQKQSKPTPPRGRAPEGEPRALWLPPRSQLTPWLWGWEPLLPTALGAGAFPAPPGDAAPPNLTTTHCTSPEGHSCPCPSPLPPQPAAAKTFPIPSCRTQSPTGDLRVSKYTNHSQSKS